MKKIMKKIKDFIGSIPKDKKLHFYAGFGISVIVGLIFAYDGTAFNNIERGVLVGVGAGVAAGIAKEVIWDLLLKKGQFDLVDAWATFFGTGLGSFLMAITLEMIN